MNVVLWLNPVQLHTLWSNKKAETDTLKSKIRCVHFQYSVLCCKRRDHTLLSIATHRDGRWFEWLVAVQASLRWTAKTTRMCEGAGSHTAIVILRSVPKSYCVLVFSLGQLLYACSEVSVSVRRGQSEQIISCTTRRRSKTVILISYMAHAMGSSSHKCW